MKKRVLIVADDKVLLQDLMQTLESEPLLPVVACSCDAGIEVALQLKPHLILVDADLAASDVTVCQRLRKDWETSEIPLLLLFDPSRARGEGLARILSADEYVEKPVVHTKLVRSIRELLRHKRGEDESRRVFDDGRLYIDFDAYHIRMDRHELKLTPKEFSLLKFLIQNQGRVFSRDKLLNVVWGYVRFAKRSTDDVHVRRIC